MKIATGVKFTIVTHASLIYADSARRYCRRAGELDSVALYEAADTTERARIEADLLDASLAAVLTANLAVEATINELYLDVSLFPHGGMFKGLEQDVRKALFDSWEHGTEACSLTTKCQIASAICGKRRLDFGKGVAQKMDLLIKLRNGLVHHKPLVIEGRREPHESADAIERQLHKAFDRATIWEGRNVQFRWSGCLGGGCASWAYETSTGFLAHFFDHLGTTYPKPQDDPDRY